MGTVKTKLSVNMEASARNTQYKLYMATIHSEGLNEILGNPCSKPRMTRIVTMNMLDRLKLSEDVLNEVIADIYKDAYVGLQKVGKDPLVNLLMFQASAFLKIRQPVYAKLCLTLVVMTTYAKLQGKYFRYCDKDTLNYVLDLMHTKSYVKRFGIAGTLDKVANDEFAKYERELLLYDDAVYPIILQSIRNRMNQIVKLIARKYHKAKAEGMKVGTGEAGAAPEEGIAGRRADYEHIADIVTHYISRNKTTDEQLLDRVNSIFRINKQMARSIIEEMHDVRSHRELTKIIVLLLNASKIKDLRDVCSKKLLDGGKKLITSRKPKSIYKEIVAEYIDNSLKRMDKRLGHYSVETKSKLMNAFNFIIIHFIREKYC